MTKEKYTKSDYSYVETRIHGIIADVEGMGLPVSEVLLSAAFKMRFKDMADDIRVAGHDYETRNAFAESMIEAASELMCRFGK